ncbi:MAG: glycosyltransferase family 39 protein [Anaerolineales bacterium]
MLRTNLKTPAPKRNKFRSFWLAISIESLLALTILLLIPPDPKNAFLLGYSLPRLIMALGIVMMGIFSFCITMSLRNNVYLGSKLVSLAQKAYNSDFFVFVTCVSSAATVTAGILFTIYWTFISEARGQEALLTRLAPLVLLVSAISVQVLRLIRSRPLISLVHKFRVWLFFPLVVLISVNFSMKLVQDIRSNLEESGKEQFIAKDSLHYYQIAETFSHFDFRMQYIQDDRAHREPLYPLLLALPYGLFNGDIFPLAMVNVVLLIVMLFIAYFSLGELLNSYIAGLAAILFVTSDEVLNSYTTVQLQTEPLFVLLSFVTNVLFLLYLQRKENKYLYTAGATAGLSYLARPNGLFLSLAMFFVLLGYELWMLLRQPDERTRNLKAVALQYGIFAGIFILTTVPSWLPRLVYTGNPIYHDYLPNFMWVDTYEEGHISGPPRYTMQDYFANHSLKDVVSRVEFGLNRVYLADTIIHWRWPASILVIVGFVFGCLAIRPEYSLLAVFMFIQMLPIVWTYLPNQTLRIPYTALMPFAMIYLAALFSVSIQALIYIGKSLLARLQTYVRLPNILAKGE